MWTYSFFHMSYTEQGYQLDTGKQASGFMPRNANLTVDHCLVEPINAVCRVGLSNTFLLVVTICILIKTVTAVVITITLGRWNQEPLVTLGDAIASFIQRPDRNTIGMCAFDRTELRQFMRNPSHSVHAGPHRWKGQDYRRGRVVPLTVWTSSYLIFLLAITVTSFFFSVVFNSNAL